MRAPQAAAQQIPETEPNNSVRMADSTALGLFAFGFINIPGDTDYYFIDLVGGTDVALRGDAARHGSPLNSVMGLLDVDGRTVLAVNDDGNDDYVTDSRIWYHVPASGRYYVWVTSADGRGGNSYDYSLNARTYTPPPPHPAVTEREPNNSIATASAAALGDTVVGILNPHGDVDYYGFDVSAGTIVKITILNSQVCLYAVLTTPGGATTDGGCAVEKGNGFVYRAAETGRYTIGIFPYDFTPGHAGLNNWYAVAIGRYKAPDPGPGNPTTVFASGFPATAQSWVHIEGTAADRTGGLYAMTNGILSHVAANGDITTVASSVYSGFGAMAVDGFGDLLVASYEPLGDGKSRGVVWRFSPSGQKTIFAATPNAPSLMFTGIAIGPDGDVWFADPGMQHDSKLWRYNPLGNLKEKIDVSATGRAWNMAMSPRGELYFVTQDGDIYELVGSSPQLVGHANATQWGNPIAFDRDGYAYVLDEPLGKIMLFDPQFHLVTDPFAQVLDSLGWSWARTGAGPVFLRDQSGSMTRRILVTRYCCEGSDVDPGDALRATVLELNQNAVRAPGADVTPRLERITPPFSVTDVANALLGGPPLPDSAVQFLDQQGNRNGILDVGDLRAYLRTQSPLSATAALQAQPRTMTLQESDRLRALVIRGSR